MTDTEPLHPAPLWRRLAARAIDTVAFSIVPGTAVLVTLSFVLAVAAGDPDADTGFLVAILVLAAWVLVIPAGLFLAFFTYEVVIPSRTGQTLGKRHMRACVVAVGSAHMAVPGMGRLTLRWLILHMPPVAMLLAGRLRFEVDMIVAVIVSALYLMLIGAPAAITSPRRGLHDMAAGTAVVDAQQLPEGHPARGPWRWKRAAPRRSAAPDSREPGADLPQGDAAAALDEQREA